MKDKQYLGNVRVSVITSIQQNFLLLLYAIAISQEVHINIDDRERTSLLQSIRFQL